MEIKVKIRGKELLLEDWVRVVDPLLLGGGYYRRNLHPDHADTSTFVELVLSSNGKTSPEEVVYSWRLRVAGAFIQAFESIYREMYPDPPQYASNQLTEMQQHVDKFIEQYNSLKVFI